MEQFLPMLEEKYGRDTRKYHENYQKILDRKTQLREKYRAFYQKLLDERRENLRKLGKADDTRTPGTAIFFAETRRKACFAPHEALIPHCFALLNKRTRLHAESFEKERKAWRRIPSRPSRRRRRPAESV